MRWKGRRQSSRVEDRRGAAPRPRRRAAAGGLGAIIVIVAIAFLTGTDPLELLQLVGEPQASVQSDRATRPEAVPVLDEQAEFVSVVLADLEDTWAQIFAGQRHSYTPPNLVLFEDAVQSACGFNSAAVGPFYCPADQRVYLDLGFFRDLSQRFGAPGDFAQAYVIAHEVGHHVQNVLGISGEVHRRQSQASRSDANELSVRLELQADCFAGVWGFYSNRDRRMLEPGDVEEGLAAAQAIGDDRLQRQAGAAVRPESWTHGSSQQRARWLRRGLESGDVERCDTLGS